MKTQKAKRDQAAREAKDILAMSQFTSEYNYEKLLRQVHPDFCRRLVERAPDMTPMEITNCMLARLHLPVKESAAILAVSISSIESHRSHARGKLQMQRGQSLTAVLHSI